MLTVKWSGVKWRVSDDTSIPFYSFQSILGQWPYREPILDLPHSLHSRRGKIGVSGYSLFQSIVEQWPHWEPILDLSHSLLSQRGKNRGEGWWNRSFLKLMASLSPLPLNEQNVHKTKYVSVEMKGIVLNKAKSLIHNLWHLLNNNSLKTKGRIDYSFKLWLSVAVKVVVVKVVIVNVVSWTFLEMPLTFFKNLDSPPHLPPPPPTPHHRHSHHHQQHCHYDHHL